MPNSNNENQKWAQLAQKFLEKTINRDEKFNCYISNFAVQKNGTLIQIDFFLNNFEILEDFAKKRINIEIQRETKNLLKALLPSNQSEEIIFNFYADGEVVNNPIEYNLKVQDGYFYYPGGGSDYSPIPFLIEHSQISKFVYCDYCFLFQITHLINDNFELIEEENIGPNFLNEELNDWGQYWHPLAYNEANVEQSYAKKMKYRCLKSKREIELIYFKTEAIGTFKLLCENWGNPSVILLQEHGGLHANHNHIAEFDNKDFQHNVLNCIGVCGNWAQFGGTQSLLYRIALESNALPKFIIKAIEPFEEFTENWPNYISYYNLYYVNYDCKKAVFNLID